METRGGEHQERFSAIDKVFGLDLLREKILDYAIHDGKEVLVPNVRSCRLVSKAWLNSTCRVLLKSREPLFRFFLASWSSTSTSQKFLRQYLKFGAKGRFISERIPPYAISTICESKIYKPCDTVSKALTNCGRSLVKLEFTFGAATFPVPLNNSLQLPRLRTLIVHVREDWGPSTSSVKMRENVDFIQSVFIASEQVKSFTFEVIANIAMLAGPRKNALGNLRLPVSITEMDLDLVLNDHMLEVLVKNDLSNLKILKFNVGSTPLKHGLITTILQKVRKTLQNLCIQDGYERIPNQTGTTCHFLPMEKLDTLSIETKYLELEESCSSLQPLVPLLSHLKLNNLQISSFRKWLERLCVGSLYSLTMIGWHYCFDEHGRYRVDSVYMDLRTISFVSQVCPNLQELHIAVSEQEKEVFMFIMAEMRNLRRLAMDVVVKPRYVYGTVNAVNSDHRWDALLTGIPIEEIPALKNSPEPRDDFEGDSSCSIRNLTSLHTLELKTVCPDWREFPDFCLSHFPLLSNLVFLLAFLRMPSLRKLVLKRGFAVTHKMAKQWREEGRVIETESWRYPDSHDSSDTNK